MKKPDGYKHRLIVNGVKTTVILDKPTFNKKIVQKFVPNEKLERGSIWYEYVDADFVIDDPNKNRGTQRSPFGIGS